MRTMPSINRDTGARRRGELNRDNGGHRLSPVIDAQRRLSGRRPRTGERRMTQVSPRDPRYAYPDAFTRLEPRASTDRRRAEGKRRAWMRYEPEGLRRGYS